MKAVIVGTGGLGSELARKHRETGDTVICFDAVAKPGVHALNVSDSKEVKDTVEKYAEELYNTDILYYTVAAMQTEDTDRIDDYDVDYALDIYNINTLGAMRVVKEMKRYMAQGGKICLITSKNGSMQETKRFMELGAAQMLAYNMSKAALNMLGVILHETLKEEKLEVLLVHPGSMRTSMSNFQGKNDPAVSASGIIELMKNEEHKDIFYSYNGERIEW